MCLSWYYTWDDDDDEHRLWRVCVLWVEVT